MSTLPVKYQYSEIIESQYVVCIINRANINKCINNNWKNIFMLNKMSESKIMITFWQQIT